MSGKLGMVLGIAAMLSLAFAQPVRADDASTNGCSNALKCSPESACSQEAQQSTCPLASSECKNAEPCSSQSCAAGCHAACKGDKTICVELEKQASGSIFTTLTKLLSGKSKGQLSIEVSLKMRDANDSASAAPCAPMDQALASVRSIARDSNCPGDPQTPMEQNDCAGTGTITEDAVATASVVPMATPPVPYPVAPTSASVIRFDSVGHCLEQASRQSEGGLAEYMARIATLEARVEMLQQMYEMQRTHHQEMMELAIENARLTERLAVYEKLGSKEERTAVASTEPQVARVPARAANYSVPQVGKCLDSVQVTEAPCTATECPTVPEVQLSPSGITVLFPSSFQLPHKMRIDTGTLLEQVIRAVDARDAAQAGVKAGER